MSNQGTRRQPARASQPTSWTQGPERINAEVQARSTMATPQEAPENVPIPVTPIQTQTMPGAMPDTTQDQTHSVTMEEVLDE